MPAKKRPFPAKIAAGIKLIVLDVDGVLTEGKITIDSGGVESKNFHVRDGLAIVHAAKAGLLTAIISGRYSKVIELRSRELNIAHVYQGIDNKKKVFAELLATLKLNPKQAAFMGDDVNDLEALADAGFSAAPADADPLVKKSVLWISSFPGGNGAVREMVQGILSKQGKWPY